jgi:hypothetical protein
MYVRLLVAGTRTAIITAILTHRIGVWPGQRQFQELRHARKIPLKIAWPHRVHLQKELGRADRYRIDGAEINRKLIVLLPGSQTRGREIRPGAAKRPENVNF